MNEQNFLIEDGVIVEYNGTGGDVTIPEGVIAIGEDAFGCYSEITSVVIPESVTVIGNGAFSGCNNLKTISIPDTITEIGNHVFSGCETLEYIHIPATVTSIGDHAFESCKALEYVTIPDGVVNIGAWAFSDCSNLEGVDIPDTVTKIGEGAFDWCEKLEEIILPPHINSIEASAFRACVKLRQVRIPKGVISIGDKAFYDCEHLIDIIIPSTVTVIGEEVFVCSESDVDEEFTRDLLSKRVIYTPAGSCAEQYAKFHCIQVKHLEDNQLTNREKMKALKTSASENVCIVYDYYVWKRTETDSNTFLLSGDLGSEVRKSHLAGCHDVWGGEIFIDYNPEEDLVGIYVKDRPIQEKFKDDLLALVDKHAPFKMQLSFDSDLTPLLSRKEKVEPQDFAEFFKEFCAAYEENYPLFYMITVSAKKWYDGFATRSSDCVDGVYY